MTENDIDKLIDESINQLSDNNINVGAESLIELAKLFAKAGMSLPTFMDLRKYIVNEAVRKTDSMFIREKLQQSEKLMRENRNGRIITSG